MHDFEILAKIMYLNGFMVSRIHGVKEFSFMNNKN